ncbi:MAG: 3-dehydroquinate synthase [Kiritimatiellae bacterium]|nr:3-dehydroquinate synthase [Kiritimatiellia bacterium]
MITETYHQHLTVTYDYPVHFTHHVIDPSNSLLANTLSRLEEDRRHRVQVFVDAGLAQAWPDINAQVTAYAAAYPEHIDLVAAPETVPGGERAKNSRDAAERVMESIADHHLCRQSFVLAIGGGSVLDIVGLAATLVHRGLRQIRIPTTVLAQNDSGVGVKNGIDAYGMKNFAGTFAPPFAVMIDPSFLKTLDDRYWIGGLGEAFKVALIKDSSFFNYLSRHSEALRRRDEKTIETVVRRSASLHLDHIREGGDPFEFGSARPLDFGHWSAHRLEVMSGYEIGHGCAVAIGVALDSFYAFATGLITSTDFDTIIASMQGVGLAVWSSLLERCDSDGSLAILRGLQDFREHLGGELHITLPGPIGTPVEINEIDPSIVIRGIQALKAYA